MVLVLSMSLLFAISESSFAGSAGHSYGLAVAGADQASTIAALRMNGTVTGGLMPTSSPQFATMVSDIQKGDYYDAAMAAINSSYFAAYLPRRMAKEMQNVSLTDSGVPDNDATTFLVAHMLHGLSNATNSGVNSGISGFWSDDVTCMINENGTATSAFKLSSTQDAAVNWMSQIECSPGQSAMNGNGNGGQIAIPSQDVGGYMTSSLHEGDSSYAQSGFLAGTNLRGIEYMWEISMGLTFAQMALQNGATPQVVAPFVPESDPNFLVGNGQSSCISCHGGGAQNILHGYSTLADVFDYDPNNGLTYFPTPSTSTMKSLGSNQNTRSQVARCIKNHAYPNGFTTCNPDSNGVDDVNHPWDLTSWEQGGLLKTMGWSSSEPIKGSGLNSLGAAVGQAGLVYQYLVQRVIGEICPLGSVSQASISSYASKAQALEAQGGPSFGSIVASVASDPSCR